MGLLGTLDLQQNIGQCQKHGHHIDSLYALTLAVINFLSDGVLHSQGSLGD